jgi:hypothetical protein
MSKLAQLIARMEGFGIPGAVPTVRNNPGDLRHSPNSSHDGEGPNDIGIIDDVADGWADLERQLQLDAERGMTLTDLIATYAPPSENNTQNYLNFICQGLSLPPTALVSDALQIPNDPKLTKET